jgi:hypothetical protein
MSDLKTITVQGVQVDITQPYTAGHPITEAEAKALNQVRAENIGNNKRAEIKKMLEEEGATTESVQKAAQASVAAYDAEYVFTLASVGGGSSRLDPLTKECRKIARDYITGRLKADGTTQKAYIEANGEEAFKAKIVEISEHPEIVKAAKKSLADREKMASIDI